MPFAHLVLTVRNVPKAQDFYAAALKPLGYKIQASVLDGKIVGFGEHSPELWISERHARKTEEERKALLKDSEQSGPAGELVHLAFAASSREQVDQFHVAAIAAGGTDNGTPGIRPRYAKNYYAAFVYDPEGRNIEAVYMGDA
ncbi:hypothetical protein CVT25_013405 [Psilocybe cyanescens]|uniref:VOC domain-containing protein n=1 Tax=Psilocybe cyanescens TaxID=93625 RepID=A0A409WST6_PSICY|nr:hypothetical protein CVT25_013405 [Psilocybe cyanescens]